MRLLGLTGSFRSSSYSYGVLRSIQSILPSSSTLFIPEIHDIPIYNGDVESQGIPIAVTNLAEEIKSSDAIIFAMEEETGFVPAKLKNALDWISRVPGDLLDGKPSSVIGIGRKTAGLSAYLKFQQPCVFLKIPLMHRPRVEFNTKDRDIFDSSTGDLTSDVKRQELKVFVNAFLKWIDKLSNCTENSIKVLGISGSLREASFQKGILRHVQNCLPKTMIFSTVDINLPIYERGMKAESDKVEAFFNAIRNADAIIFASPEYNFSVSGVLKNALDWASTEDVFSGKPAMVLGAGGGNATALSQLHFREIAISLNLQLMLRPEVQIRAFAPGIMDKTTGDIESDEMKTRIEDSLKEFNVWCQKRLPNVFETISTNTINMPVLQPISSSTDSWKSSKQRILIISDTVSTNSCCAGVSRYILNTISDDFETLISNIKDIPLYNGDVEKDKGFPTAVQVLIDQIESADMIYIVLEETTFGVSGLLKNALDWASRKLPIFKDKPVELIGLGKSSTCIGYNAVSHLKQIGLMLGIRLTSREPLQISTNPDDNLFNFETGELIDSETQSKIQDSVDKFTEFKAKIISVVGDHPIRILAIPGSLRQASVNRGLIRCIQENLTENMVMDIVDIASIPWKEDTTDGEVPPSVSNFWNQLQSADAIIFASPEYNFSYTGAMKNVIEWGIHNSNRFSNIPAGIIGGGGGLGASKSNLNLREVLYELEVPLLNQFGVRVRNFEEGNIDLKSGNVKSDKIKEQLKDFCMDLNRWTHIVSK